MRFVFWGTYDTGKPRTRILLQGLRENGVEVLECHANVWADITDKTLLSGAPRKLHMLTRWILSYPGLVIRYLQLPKHDVVLIGYMGQLDVLVLWLFARIRKVPIILDAYLPLYNTIVEDRGLRKPGAVASLVYYWEWLAYRAANLVLVDTKAHAQYFRNAFKLSDGRVSEVWVGAEPKAFAPAEPFSRRQFQDDRPKILFYGSFIPLQGIDTIVQAAYLSEEDGIDWVIIGRGQEAERIRQTLEHRPPRNLRWVSWVPYEQVVDWIHQSHVCLGIFGDTAKAARVIPNKVFQILMAGAPLVTRDSSAIRELLDPQDPGVVLVPPADPKALLKGVRRLCSEIKPHHWPLHRRITEQFTPKAIGRSLIKLAGDLRT